VYSDAGYWANVAPPGPGASKLKVATSARINAAYASAISPRWRGVSASYPDAG